MIPINRPDISRKDILSFFYPKNSLDELESFFSNWLGGKKYCLFTSSGKTAIYLLFKFLNIKGNVLTSPLTCSIALKPILANGVALKFADVNFRTFNVDIDSLGSTIDKNTRAIYLIHLGGVPCDIGPIKKIANDKNILLIEDCAQALGSTYNGIKVGNFGDYSCFSFSKNVWLGGGGMICSDNPSVLEKIRKYQNSLPEIPKKLLHYRFKRDLIEFGRGNPLFDFLYYRIFLKKCRNANIDIKIKKYFKDPSVLHRPSIVQASVIKSQLETFDLKQEKRIKNAGYLSSFLMEKFIVQKIDPNNRSAYPKYYLLVRNNKKIIPYLVSKGIDAKHLTKSHGVYFQRRFDKDEDFRVFNSINECDVYKQIHDKIISLPISSNMKEKELRYIVDVLQKVKN